MPRKIVKPLIRIESVFSGERSLEDAFGEAYACYYDHIEKAKSSSDTFASGKFTEYDQARSPEEVKNNGTAVKENRPVLQTVEG